MIIFDLDGTLANCEHRRHFVDPIKNNNIQQWIDISTGKTHYGYHYEKGIFKKWEPDWKSFNEACEQDEPICPVISIWDDQISLGCTTNNEIWSGRCESVREKTEKWLNDNLMWFTSNQLKMRPIGDSTPDDILKERWLDETIAKGKRIEYVFDDRPKVIKMWRRRGIFVFDCNQTGEFF